MPEQDGHVSTLGGIWHFEIFLAWPTVTIPDWLSVNPPFHDKGLGPTGRNFMWLAALSLPLIP